MAPHVFKLSHEGTLRKLVLPARPAWPALARQAASLFALDAASVALTYVDEDGDELTLSSQAELEGRYAEIAQGETLRFSVRILGPASVNIGSEVDGSAAVTEYSVDDTDAGDSTSEDSDDWLVDPSLSRASTPPPPSAPPLELDHPIHEGHPSLSPLRVSEERAHEQEQQQEAEQTDVKVDKGKGREVPVWPDWARQETQLPRSFHPTVVDAEDEPELLSVTSYVNDDSSSHPLSESRFKEAFPEVERTTANTAAAMTPASPATPVTSPPRPSAGTLLQDFTEALLPKTAAPTPAAPSTAGPSTAASALTAPSNVASTAAPTAASTAGASAIPAADPPDEPLPRTPANTSDAASPSLSGDLLSLFSALSAVFRDPSVQTALVTLFARLGQRAYFGEHERAALAQAAARVNAAGQTASASVEEAMRKARDEGERVKSLLSEFGVISRGTGSTAGSTRESAGGEQALEQELATQQQAQTAQEQQQAQQQPSPAQSQRERPRQARRHPVPRFGREAPNPYYDFAAPSSPPFPSRHAHHSHIPPPPPGLPPLSAGFPFSMPSTGVFEPFSSAPGSFPSGPLHPLFAPSGPPPPPPPPPPHPHRHHHHHHGRGSHQPNPYDPFHAPPRPRTPPFPGAFPPPPRPPPAPQAPPAPPKAPTFGSPSMPFFVPWGSTSRSASASSSTAALELRLVSKLLDMEIGTHDGNTAIVKDVVREARREGEGEDEDRMLARAVERAFTEEGMWGSGKY